MLFEKLQNRCDRIRDPVQDTVISTANSFSFGKFPLSSGWDSADVVVQIVFRLDAERKVCQQPMSGKSAKFCSNSTDTLINASERACDFYRSYCGNFDMLLSLHLTSKSNVQMAER